MTNAWDEKIFSGAFVAGSAGTIEVTAPATGAVIATIGKADVEDLDRAVAAAKAAQPAWAALPYTERAAVMTKAAALLAENPERLTRWIVPESGSGQGKAGFEAMLVTSELSAAASLAAQPYGQMLRSMKPRVSIGRYVPVGVVGVISPFNFPAILSMRSVAPALALGNAVVLKPDPRTSISGGLALAELFAEAGLPEGILHVLPAGAVAGPSCVVVMARPVQMAWRVSLECRCSCLIWETDQPCCPSTRNDDAISPHHGARDRPGSGAGFLRQQVRAGRNPPHREREGPLHAGLPRGLRRSGGSQGRCLARPPDAGTDL